MSEGKEIEEIDELGEFGLVSKGTEIIRVRNLELAVCLVSIGVPLRKDPPYTHSRLKSGIDQWTFNFESKDVDGQFFTMDMVKGFAQDAKFVEDNPVHPFTFAMAAVKNLAMFKDHMARSTPYVSFKAKRGKATLFVQEGSRKHKRLLKKGMVQL